MKEDYKDTNLPSDGTDSLTSEPTHSSSSKNSAKGTGKKTVKVEPAPKYGKRLRKIVTVLTKHRVLESLALQSHPERVVDAFEELGPTFIKLGQILSVRPDIVSPKFAEGLSTLQSDVKPDSFEVMKPLIEEYIGKPIEEVFSSFDTQVMASASIAQVYKAVLKTGQKVIVKVQHPGVEQSMTLDVNLLEKAIPLIERIPAAKVMDPAEIVQELKSSLNNELNFLLEADNIETFRYTNRDQTALNCPGVYEEYTSKHLLVMDFMEGTGMSQFLEKYKDAGINDIEAQSRKHKIAVNIINNYMNQVLAVGFFHADPHPGNIIIQEQLQDKIAYIDFGMMGNLTGPILEKFNELMVAIVSEDSDSMARVVLRLCKQRRPVDKEALSQEIEGLMGKYYDASLEDISLPEIMGDLTQVAAENGLVMPRNVALLAKGLMTIEGVVEELDPQVTIMSAVVPYVQKYMKNNFDLKSIIKKQSKSLFKLFLKLPKIPEQLMKTLDKASKGQFEVVLEHKGLDKLLDRFSKIVNRLVIGIIVAALIMGASNLMSFESILGQNFPSILATFALLVAFFLCGVLLYLTWRDKNDSK